jgi:hypothetical protein
MRRVVRVGLLAVAVTSFVVSSSGRHAVADPAVAHPASADSAEHANIIDASDPANNYAVIAPVFASASGASSYIRLFSGTGGQGQTSTFTFSVVGIPSARQYGANYSIAIPYMASVQFSIQDILAVTRAGALNSGDTSYAVYLKNPDAQAGYQHVTYNAETALFENGNNCHTSINEQMIAAQNAMVVTNLHMPTIPAYPSTVTIHNHSATPTTYALDVHAGGVATVSGATATVASTAGNLLCQVSRTVPANSSATIPFSTISSLPECAAADNQFYANIKLRNIAGGPPDATVAHWVRVNRYGGDSNLGGVCAINRITRPVVTSTTTVAAIVKGSTAAEHGVLSVTIQPTSTASAQVRAATPATESVQNTQWGIERPKATATATGTYTLASGAVVNVSGTYNTATNAVRLAGGGYNFTGVITTETYAGSYVGPNNVTGKFTGKSTVPPVKSLCGGVSGEVNNGRMTLWFYVNGTVSGTVLTADNETISMNGYHGANLNIVGYSVGGNSFHGWGDNGSTFQGRFTSDTSGAGTATSSEGAPLTFNLGSCPDSMNSSIGVRG